MPESHAPNPTAESPPGGLSEEEWNLLRPHSPETPRVERPEPEPIDWQARVEAIAARSRPQRQRVQQERTARQRRIDETRRQRVIAATLDRLDRRFGRFTAERPEYEPLVRAVVRLQRREVDGIVLRGPVGCGKTHEAVAAFRYLVRERAMLPAVAVTVPALLDGLRPGREPVETLDAVESAGLLLLDDLAAERSTDWTAEVLYRVIDARYARKLPTIVTTNATGEQLRANLGDRIASRLNGLGAIVSWAPDAPDRRRPDLH